MSSHAPYAHDAPADVEAAAPTAPAGKFQQHPVCAAATAPAGKPHPEHDPDAFSPQDEDNNVLSQPQQLPGVAPSNNHQTVAYVLPMSAEAAAAPPVRTMIESTEAAPHSDTNAVQQLNAGTMTTRIVTLQPCKIVYHYADNTEHTYILQTSTTTAAALPAPQNLNNTNTKSNTTTSQQQQQQQLRRRRAGGGAGEMSEPAVHGVARLPSTRDDTSSLVSFKSDGSDNDAAMVREHPEQQALLAPTCATCGHCRSLVDVYKPPEHVADITPANPRIGSPGPVTLFAFGFTTCLYNVHQAGICPMNLTTMGLICFYGGLAQFVGGFFELMNKNTIFCTLDVTYGAFWMATAVTNLVPANDNVVADAPKNYMGGFFMLWFFFAGTMFASSFKFSYVQMLLNFSVTLNFFLNFLGSFIGSETLLHVAGYEGIVEGCLATYVGMAFSMRDIYGRSILPLFFQKNFKITEW